MEIFGSLVLLVSDLFNKHDKVWAGFYNQFRLYIMQNYTGKIYFVKAVSVPPPYIVDEFGWGFYIKVDDIFPFLIGQYTKIKDVNPNDPSHYSNVIFRVKNKFTMSEWDNGYDWGNQYVNNPVPNTPGWVQIIPVYDHSYTHENIVNEHNKGYAIISATSIHNGTGDANETFQAEVQILKQRIVNSYYDHKTNYILGLVVLIVLVALSSE